MKVALYVGDHAADGRLARLGWWSTRKVQKGPLSIVTHTENIHAEHADGSVTIASASLRDGGVRDKDVRLNPWHWMIVDVPAWDVSKSANHLEKTRGKKYDYRGAVATVFIGSPDPSRDFCNSWCAAPFLKCPANLSPSQFAAVCLSLGQDVTAAFFSTR